MAKRVVISLFDDEAAADSAAVALKDSGVAKHDAIGVLVLDESGDLKAHKLGAHSVYKGAGIGFVLALLGPIGVGIGATAGGALGLLHHKGLGLSDRDRERISAELALGKAGVGVLADFDEAPSIDAKLTELGGRSEVHAFSDEALEEAAEAVAAGAAGERLTTPAGAIRIAGGRSVQRRCHPPLRLESRSAHSSWSALSLSASPDCFHV